MNGSRSGCLAKVQAFNQVRSKQILVVDIFILYSNVFCYAKNYSILTFLKKIAKFCFVELQDL